MQSLMSLLKLRKESPKPIDVVPKKVDVIGQKDIIIPVLERLVRGFFGYDEYAVARKKYSLQKKTSDPREANNEKLSREIKSLIEHIWGRLPVIRKKDLLCNTENYICQHKELEGHNILNYSKNAIIIGCVVHGEYILFDSIRPTVKDSFILGDLAVRGRSARNLSAEEYLTFVELELDFLSGNPERVLKALSKFGKVMRVSKYKDEKRLLQSVSENNYQAIVNEDYNLVHSLYLTLPLSEKKGLEHVLGNEKMVFAAHEINGLINCLLENGDTYHIDIDNSVIVGLQYVGRGIKGGTITNSIIASRNPHMSFNGANLRIENCYLITKDETRKLEGILGEPDVYQKIPVSLLNKHLKPQNILETSIN